MDEMLLVRSGENSSVKDENTNEKTAMRQTEAQKKMEERKDIMNVTSSFHAQLDTISKAGAS